MGATGGILRCLTHVTIIFFWTRTCPFECMFQQKKRLINLIYYFTHSLLPYVGSFPNLHSPSPTASWFSSLSCLSYRRWIAFPNLHSLSPIACGLPAPSFTCSLLPHMGSLPWFALTLSYRIWVLFPGANLHSLFPTACGFSSLICTHTLSYSTWVLFPKLLCNVEIWGNTRTLVLTTSWKFCNA